MRAVQTYSLLDHVKHAVRPIVVVQIHVEVVRIAYHAKDNLVSFVTASWTNGSRTAVAFNARLDEHLPAVPHRHPFVTRMFCSRLGDERPILVEMLMVSINRLVVVVVVVGVVSIFGLEV